MPKLLIQYLTNKTKWVSYTESMKLGSVHTMMDSANCIIKIINFIYFRFETGQFKPQIKIYILQSVFKRILNAYKSRKSFRRGKQWEMNLKLAEPYFIVLDNNFAKLVDQEK